MKRPPINYILQIDTVLLNEVMFLWSYYDQPCSMLLLKPKTEGLTAIKVVVASDEAATFVERVIKKTSARLYVV